MLSRTLSQTRSILRDGSVKSIHRPSGKLSAGLLRRQYATAKVKGTFNWDNPHDLAPTLKRETLQNSTPHDRRNTELVAINEAIGGHGANLLFCMTTSLQEKNPKAVIDLYDRYMEARTRSSATPDVHEKSDNALAFDDVKENDLKVPDLHAQVVLAAVAAHALEGSLEGACGAFERAQMGWPEALSHRFIQNLSLSAEETKTIAAYMQDVQIFHWLSNSSAFSRHLKSLAHSRSLPQIMKLYEGVLQGIQRKDPFILPIDTLQSPTTPARPTVSMTEITWGAFLSAFLRCDRPDLAQQLWQMLQVLKITPGTPLWTTYLDGFDHLRLSAAALRTWQTMVRNGVKPEALTYRAIISVCLRDNEEILGMRKFKEFQAKEGEAGWSESHRRSVYNTTIDGLLLRKSLSKATELLEEMKANGPTPDVVTYNILLGYYYRRNDFKGISQAISGMSAAGISGNEHTFSMLLSALLKAGRADATDIVFRCMKQHGIAPNVAIYTTLIDNLLQKQTDASWKAVFKILDSMNEERNVTPNDVTYTSLLTNLHRGDFPPETKAAFQQNILRRMRAHRVQLNLAGYHTVIRACFEAPSNENVANALGYYREIQHRGIPLVQTTWYLLLAGLAQVEAWDLARHIVNDMYLSKIVPSASLSRLASRIVERTS